MITHFRRVMRDGLLALALFPCVVLASSYSDSVTIYYQVDSVKVDLSLANNRSKMEQLDSLFAKINRESLSDVKRVVIESQPSPEGDEQYNQSLSKDRADKIKKSLMERYNLDESLFECKLQGIDWKAFRELVEKSDIRDKQAVIKIIDNVPAETWGKCKPTDKYMSLLDSRDKHLKDYRGGTTYRLLQMVIFPQLRYANVTVDYTMPETVVNEESQPSTTQPAPVDHVAELPSAEEQVASIEVPQSFNRLYAVKTNLAVMGALGVSNIGFEVSINNRLSLDFPIYYSPYTIKDDWRFRFSIVQPEVRYWLAGNCMEGQFVGLHLHYGLFNVATDDGDRYQNSNDKPLWGFGVSYGYALPLSKRLNLEFNLGVGYASLRYDIFYNVDNGVKYDYNEKSYWGVTRAGISLSYIINRK